MKKIILAATTLLIVCAIGCNGVGGGDPKAVLVSFFDALSKKDFEGAKKLATADSKSMIDMMATYGKNAKIDKYDKSKMQFGDAKIEGDKATVPVKEISSGEGTDFTLRKESGSWKVAFDKTTLMQQSMDKMKEKGIDMNKMMDSSNMNRLNGLSDSMRAMQEEINKNDTSH